MLTVIYYHEVVPNGQGAHYQKIDIDKFEEQMRYLSENGFTTLKFSQLKGKLPKKAVIVSFDDGLRSVYENAIPIMKKYGIVSNVYLPTKYIGNDLKFMDWEMVQNAGDDVEFQAHTHSHVDVRTLLFQELQEEIESSDVLFKEKLNFMPTALCLPYGAYDRKSKKNLKAISRYDFVLGSYYGKIKKLKKNKILPRIGISNKDDIVVFANKLKGKYNYKGIVQRLRLKLQNLKKQTVTKYDY